MTKSAAFGTFLCSEYERRLQAITLYISDRAVFSARIPSRCLGRSLNLSGNPGENLKISRDGLSPFVPTVSLPSQPKMAHLRFLSFVFGSNISVDLTKVFVTSFTDSEHAMAFNYKCISLDVTCF